MIPAHNEAASIGETIETAVAVLRRNSIDYEIVVVDDASGDGTFDIVAALAARNARIRCIRSANPPGFGYAVRAGLAVYSGDAVAVMMADRSDRPRTS